MYTGPSVFSQLIDSLSRYAFQNCVLQYNGDHYVKSFPCWQQFLCLCFGQLTFRESLRSIVLCLNAHPTKLYHLGLRGAITKSTLAEANEQLLNDIDGTFYALDSTTIDLCLSVFHWAHFRETKGAVKLHTLLDLRGNIPVFVHISDGTVHDVNILDTLPIESGAYYVMDRGYIDYRRLYAIHQANAFFIIRAKQNLCFVRLYSHPTNRHTGILCDQIIRFHSDAAQEKYPEKLRRVKYRDATTKNTYVYLTNNMTISALQIADIYKHRWGIEQFFKWIKGHLKIRVFWGTSLNAVKTQIWVAICTYLMVAIVKKQLNSNRSMYEILQILSITIFEKTPMNTLFSAFDTSMIDVMDQKQLFLFDF